MKDILSTYAIKKLRNQYDGQWIFLQRSKPLGTSQLIVYNLQYSLSLFELNGDHQLY